MNLVNKFKNHPFAKYAIAILGVVLLFIIYKIHIWVNTQSTDNAYIEADISIVSAEVNGIVEEVFIKENNFIKKGQIVAKINDEDYIARFKKAEAAFDEANLDIETIEQDIKLAEIDKVKAREAFDFAEANYKIIEVDYKRTQELSKDNFASKKSLDNTEIAFEKAKNEFSQAQLNMLTSQEKLTLLGIQRLASIAKLRTLRQEITLAKTALNHTNIKTPIDGIIGNSSLKVGNYVRTGIALFCIIPVDHLYVKANFKETQISKFLPGMKAKLTFDSEPGTKIIGVIRNISPATGSKFSLLPSTNATGNFTKIVQRVPVLIDFEIPQLIKDKIVPGMSTIVEIRTDQTPT